MKKRLLFIFYVCLVVYASSALKCNTGIVCERLPNQPLINVPVHEKSAQNGTVTSINKELLILVNSYQII